MDQSLCKHSFLCSSPGISCGDPGLTANSNRTASGFAFQSTVNYSCHPGYDLHGYASLLCLSSGRWSKLPPTCKPVECPFLLAPPYATLHGSNFTFKSLVRVKCAAGFALVGLSQLRCEATASWSHELPRCLPNKCPILSAAHNMVILKQNNSYLGHWKGQCVQGYTLLGGDEIRECLANGSWSGAEMVCTGNALPRNLALASL